MRHVCCAKCQRTLAQGEQEANARLIGAAPELLAACRELVSQFDQYLAGWTGSPLPIRIGLPADLDAARSAIAEAEGR